MDYVKRNVRLVSQDQMATNLLLECFETPELATMFHFSHFDSEPSSKQGEFIDLWLKIDGQTIMISDQSPENPQEQNLHHVNLPIRLCDLLQAMEKTLKFAEAPFDQSFYMGSILCNPRTRTLSFKEKTEKTTDKEMLILQHLWRLNGDFAERRDLLRRIWGYDEAIDTHTLETHIYRIRQKLTNLSQDHHPIIAGTGGYGLSRQS